MIGFGLRLAVAGGREALTRLVVIAVAVAVGTGLLLTTLAGINAANAQLLRYASLYPTSSTEGSGDPLWWATRGDYFHGEPISRIDVAATGPAAPDVPGIADTPGPGEYYASPAMRELLAANPADQLAARYPARDLGAIAPAGLASPDSLLIVVGGTPGEVAALPNARQVTAVAVTSAVPASVVNMIMAVIAAGLLFPVLVFIGTATRLGAARREQRFAAMRLVGATPHQITLFAAVEAGAAAVAGTAAGFALFRILRDTLAAIPFTGMPFFPGDMSLSPVNILLVAVGVPAGAALAAQLSLRRVQISALGVTRRVTPKAPRPYRIIPAVFGVGILIFAIEYRPSTSNGQIMLFLPAILLIMTGLILAGPWLTMTVARLMARHADRPAALLAARRLADNPRAGFRAVSGIMLALFVTSVAIGVITTIAAERGPAPVGSAEAGTLSATFATEPQADPGPVLDDLRAIPGVRTTTVIRANPVTEPGHHAGVVACADIPQPYGRCADGVNAAETSTDFTLWRESASASTIWPEAPVPVTELARLPMASIVVGTDGSAAAIERARTVLERAYSASFWTAPNVPGDFASQFTNQLRGWQQLAEVIIVASLALAGCSLAVSVAGGLTERKRPFSLLRLSGTPVQTLRRVVALEATAPMFAVTVVAVATGLLAAQLFLRSQMGYTLVAPGWEFYAIVTAGIAACLGITAGTLPLLERITGPQTARTE
ncbi:ABC transporter permease [Actinoplanes sp. NEAU-A12]|uniref:ABC transporter permease n=1 Tax=Actinoplanes sandaracinus TaxID=3045177 RepID=A0ABT6WWP7_9ACTN|nr:FtsX-like permease family protein [Actinoplanes sandaracinus]MDI6104171.1 ABC transporter permease [Actinoplanes sandaracinus]